MQVTGSKHKIRYEDTGTLARQCLFPETNWRAIICFATTKVICERTGKRLQRRHIRRKTSLHYEVTSLHLEVPSLQENNVVTYRRLNQNSQDFKPSGIPADSTLVWDYYRLKAILLKSTRPYVFFPHRRNPESCLLRHGRSTSSFWALQRSSSNHNESDQKNFFAILQTGIYEVRLWNGPSKGIAQSSQLTSSRFSANNGSYAIFITNFQT